MESHVVNKWNQGDFSELGKIALSSAALVLYSTLTISFEELFHIFLKCFRYLDNSHSSEEQISRHKNISGVPKAINHLKRKKKCVKIQESLFHKTLLFLLASSMKC